MADFRRRDIAAGGEGAPLAPAFHEAVFGHPGKRRAVVNIGGIANATLLGGAELTGFDCGPGNTLLDQWAEAHIGQHYDPDGSWGAGGEVIDDLLRQLLGHPWFDLPPPKSTGKESFNLAWLHEALRDFAAAKPQDVQATLAELTAATISRVAGIRAGAGGGGLCVRRRGGERGPDAPHPPARRPGLAGHDGGTRLRPGLGGGGGLCLAGPAPPRRAAGERNDGHRRPGPPGAGGHLPRRLN